MGGVREIEMHQPTLKDSLNKIELSRVSTLTLIGQDLSARIRTDLFGRANRTLFGSGVITFNEPSLKCIDKY
jgi:hypothetical protein